MKLFDKAPYNRKLLYSDKIDLIDRAVKKHGMKSFADLGGVWLVEGGYSFYAAHNHRITGLLVDTHPTAQVREYEQQFPSVRIIQGGFGDFAIAEQTKGVDAVFLFDVLLHQVRPNWDEVLKLYSHVRILVIYNQQWTGPETVRLFDLGENEYFQNAPHEPNEPPYNDLFQKLDTPHPDYSDRNWRDVHHVWQWGITDRDLLTAAFDLGYSLEFFDNYGPFGALPQFENHGFILVRR